MDSKRRERSTNFNTAEVQLLVSLVEKFKLVIENKKTDAVTNKDKENAWKKIESSFNSCGISSSIRSWKTLKLKYEGIKKTTKKKSSLQRQEMYRTGGGPSNAPDFNDVEEKVLGICSNITGLEPRHDSDTIPAPVVDINLKDNEPPTIIYTELEENEIDMQANIKIPDMDDSFILEVVDEDNESQKENKWDKWRPNTLKSRVSKVLKPAVVNKATVTSKLDQLSTARLELVQLQMETARKQLQFIEDEHNAKMLSLDNDEKRKQEMHELLKQKLCSGLVNNFS